MSLGMPEILIILLILLLLFGAKRLPELARGLGRSIKEFKKAASDIQNEIDQAANPDHPVTHPPKSSEEPNGRPPQAG